jgi:hypothetical protein
VFFWESITALGAAKKLVLKRAISAVRAKNGI